MTKAAPAHRRAGARAGAVCPILYAHLVLWRGPDGFEVESITLDDRQLLRVCRWFPRGRFFVQYCASVEEVAALVPLEDLVEVYVLRCDRPGSRRIS